MNKKGQVLNGLSELAVGIAVLTIVLTIAFLVLDEGREQADNLAQGSTFNQSYTVSLDNFVVLSGGCSLESDLSVNCVYNDTVHGAGGLNCMNQGASSITPNWTVSGNTINVSDNALGNVGLAAGINVSYTCKQADHAHNGTAVLTNATSTVPGWVPLIVITVIGSLLLGLVAMFRRR